MDNSRLRESREAHPLTTKEDAEKQVAEFDKVQPQSVEDWEEEEEREEATNQ